jgi:hypothetical protein
VLRTPVHCVLIAMCACKILIVDILISAFDGVWGMCGEISYNVLIPLFMVLWVPIFVMLCHRAMPMLWHAYMFLGLRHMGYVSPFSFLIGGFHFFFQ